MKKQKTSSTMNIVLWALQIALAFWTFTGASYMMSNYRVLANVWALDALPEAFWMILASIEILFAIGLVLPRTRKFLPQLRSLSAAGLAMTSLLGIVLFVAFSGFPGMLWGVLPAAIAALIAYKRWN